MGAKLKRMRVPTEIVLPLVKMYVDQYDAVADKPLEWLAEDIGCSPSTVLRLYTGNSMRADTIDFDVADRLVCKTVGPMFWRQPGIREIYDAVILEKRPSAPKTAPCPAERECAYVECSTVFSPSNSRARYCSKRCKERSYKRGVRFERPRPRPKLAVA